MFLPKLSILLVTLFFAAASRKYTPKGTWPQMLLGLCRQVKMCTYNVKMLQDLTSHLYNTTGIEVSRPHGIYRVVMKKGKLTYIETCGRMKPSGSKRQHQKHKSRRNPNHRRSAIYRTKDQMLFKRPTNKGRPKATNKKSRKQKDKFMLKLTKRFLNKNCTVMSMALGRRDPNVIYLLLQCSNQKRCYHEIHIAYYDTKIARYSNSLCKKQNGKMQIFTGPCEIDKTGDCLYSVHVGLGLTFTSYIELESTKMKLKTHRKHIRERFSCKTCLCSFYKSYDLLCLVNGLLLKSTQLKPDVDYVIMRSKTWQLPQLPGIRDFKIDVNSDYAIIVQKSSFTIIYFNYAENRMRKLSSTPVEAMTGTMRDGNILWHNGSLEQPFYQCNINQDCSGGVESVCCRAAG